MSYKLVRNKYSDGLNCYPYNEKKRIFFVNIKLS